jgi:hypothetical protein
VLAENSKSGTNNEQTLQLNESVSDGQMMWKQVGLWFTFNQEKKIEKELELARLRLIQAKVAAKNNNPKAMEKALEAHEKILERIKERMGKLESGKDLNSSTEKLVGLERAIRVHEQRINFMNYLLLNANLSEEQKSKIEMKISKAKNVTARLSELNDEKKKRIKTRLIDEKNMSGKEAEDFIKNKGYPNERGKVRKMGDVEKDSIEDNPREVPWMEGPDSEDNENLTTEDNDENETEVQED